MRDSQERQSGGVVTFIIVGFVLAALLAGSIYVSKQQGRTASRTNVATTNSANNTNSAKSSEENKRDQETKPESKPAEQQPSTATPAPQPTTGSTQAPAQSNSTPSTTPGQGANVPATGPTHIATTGPSNVLIPGLGVALMAAGVISYRRSRRTLRSQALSQ